MDLIWKILITIAFTVFAGYYYRAGGSASIHARWFRQFGIGMSVVGTLITWFGFHWWMLLSFGLSWAESTYFKHKGTEATWWNWALVGLVFSIVPLPWVIADAHHWMGFFLRAGLLIPAITTVGTWVGNVQWSEGLRGALQILTLPILLF